jgi:hypothetical protein
MSNLSFALVVPTRCLRNEAIDLVREHCTNLMAASLLLNSEYKSEASRWECRCPHVNKVPDNACAEPNFSAVLL